MKQFKDLKSKDGLKELNEWLQTRSYIDGYQATAADVKTFDDLGNLSSNDFPHVTRWHNHIKSFSSDERKHFGAVSAAGTSSGDTKPKGGDADDDFDLFGDEDEEDDEEKEKIKKERLEAYAAKKSNKPGPIAKSSIVLDIKPWDDETDLNEIERRVRAIQKDGLIWSKEAKQLPVAFGIKKLQIGCVVEDEKISVDALEEEILEFEDLVQSVDIAAFNKI